MGFNRLDISGVVDGVTSPTVDRLPYVKSHSPNIAGIAPALDGNPSITFQTPFATRYQAFDGEAFVAAVAVQAFSRSHCKDEGRIDSR